jgi:thiol-disulfide isomerase/thioredoxin
MKKLFGFLLLLLLTACGNSGQEENAQDLDVNFSVSGKISDAGNIPLYLEAMSQSGSIKVAETTVAQDGTFKLEGNIPGMGIYQIRLGESQDKVIPLTLSPKEHVKMNTSFDAFSIDPNFSGAEWTAPMNKYMALYAGFLNGQMDLNALQGQLSEEELMARYLALRKPIDDFALQQMGKDPDNPINIILSSSAAPTTGFENWDPKNLEVLQSVAEAYKKKYAGSPMASTMENQVFQIQSAYQEYELSKNGSNSGNAALAPEISLKDPNGKIRKLSSLRGKIVLVDFWASWCGPCRRENPNVVKLYKKYKDKGFTVFSVSLDDKPAAWKQAIAADGLIWPDHVSDLMGWQTPLIQSYGFNSIPHTVLIDKEGKIIATGLRGESLEQKLKELMPN